MCIVGIKGDFTISVWNKRKSMMVICIAGVNRILKSRYTIAIIRNTEFLNDRRDYF